MHFRTKILLRFAIVSLVVFAIGRIHSPIIYLDKSFVGGKKLQEEFLELRNYLWTVGGEDVMAARGIEERFDKIHSNIDAIVDDGRERYYSYPRWFSDALAFAVLIVGLIIATLVSWRADVSRLQKELDAEQVEDADAE